MSTTGTVRTEGAELVYDFVGKGPLLLTIAGGGGAGERYAPLADLLSDEYTVVRYDRRGNSRSTGDRGADLDMAQQGRDALAVIRALGREDAFVFGNSAGGNIALEMAARHPEAVKAVIVHEPPIMAILPDSERWLRFVEEVHATVEAEGAAAGARKFMGSLVGFSPADRRGGPLPNLEFFMVHEYRNMSVYRPDLEALLRHKVRVTALSGRSSGEAYYARTARVLAEKLGCRYAEVAGNHNAFWLEPESFARSLRGMLQEVPVEGLEPPHTCV